MIVLYNIFGLILFILSLPYIVIRLISRRRSEWLERLGFIKSLIPADYIWVHCASVGELKTSVPFINRLRKDMPSYKIILSLITPSGKEVAIKENLPVGKIIHLPVDLFFCINKVIKMVSPKLLVLVETELWPNLICSAKRKGARVVLVNGRISLKSFRVYRIFRFFFGPVLNKIDMFLMREKIDYENILKLGADKNKIVITGNMKYDQITEKKVPDREKIYSEMGIAENSLVFTAGSVREGEEKLVIDAYLQVLKKYPQMKLIFVPRHLERVGYVEKVLKEKDVSFVRKSHLTAVSDKQCLLLDTYGELFKAYTVAKVVFVGGSLIPLGGQNILEPASLGKVVLFGPYTESFAEPAEVLENSGAGIRVTDFQDLADKVIYLLDNPDVLSEKEKKAKQAVLSMRGAVEKNIKFIHGLL